MNKNIIATTAALFLLLTPVSALSESPPEMVGMTYEECMDLDMKQDEHGKVTLSDMLAMDDNVLHVCSSILIDYLTYMERNIKPYVSILENDNNDNPAIILYREEENIVWRKYKLVKSVWSIIDTFKKGKLEGRFSVIEKNHPELYTLIKKVWIEHPDSIWYIPSE